MHVHVHTLYWHGAVCISRTCVWLLTSLEANSFSSGQLHVSDRHWPSRASAPQRSEAFSDRQQPAPWSSVNWATLERSTTVHGAVSSDKQLCRYLKNGVSITEVKVISLAACKVGLAFLKLNCYFLIFHGHGCGTLSTHYGMANGRVRVPFMQNGTERKCHFFWRLLYSVLEAMKQIFV